MNPFVLFAHKVSALASGMIEKIVRLMAEPVIRITGVPWDESKWESLFQFVKFCMIGVSNVLVSYSINISTLLFLRRIAPGFQFDYVIANTAAFLLSVLWSYYWNSRKVFKTENAGGGPKTGNTLTERLRPLLRTYASYAFSGIILNNVLSTFWIHVVGVSRFVSPLLNIPITMPVNFLILKKWAFGRKAGRTGNCSKPNRKGTP